MRVPAELDPPNNSYTYTWDHHYVRVSDDKIFHDFISNFRSFCAATLCPELGISSCIIDGIPWGPTPGPKTHGWMFVDSRPVVEIKEWHNERKHHPFPDNRDEQIVRLTARVGYKYTESLHAPWRAYPEVTNETDAQLWQAIDDAINGRAAVMRVPTVTDPNGRPKSA